ncbi:hypothetical protein LA76x_4159 [Lysobacter antibioticus]|uniref:Transglutaminase-like superfamily protein n=2 Tax=Lysobacter antibioticus TaxID=84531 RepID=A0A0S2FFF9_LYSAN|nr:hypothetical protein LA76x_4159 [Lysobacter antibioticus]
MQNTGPGIRLFFGALILSALSLSAAATPPTRPSAANTNISAEPNTVADLVARLRKQAEASQSSPAVRADYDALRSAQSLSAAQLPYADYAYLRLLFEATRDGGYWNLHWAITDREPNSDAIWSQWRARRGTSPTGITATAECDELSALYAFLARRGGVRNVGLFWPTANHTVAVWRIPAAPRETRIVVPTTQIFLSQYDSFGSRGFDPWKQAKIYEYGRRDIADDARLPPALIGFFLAQNDKYARASGLSLQRMRQLRDGVLAGSLSADQARRKRNANASHPPPSTTAARTRISSATCKRAQQRPSDGHRPTPPLAQLRLDLHRSHIGEPRKPATRARNAIWPTVSSSATQHWPSD